MSCSPDYEKVLQPHLDDLRKYCFYLARSKWDGEDLFQEAVLRSFQHTRTGELGDRTKFFLLRVARNLWIDDCRRRQRQRQLRFPHDALIGRDADYFEVRSLMDWMFERLPRRNIEMWLFSEYFGYTMQDIAGFMQLTLPAVKSVLHRTRITLRRLKQEEGGQGLAGRFHHPVAERWSRAILLDRPHDLLPESACPAPGST